MSGNQLRLPATAPTSATLGVGGQDESASTAVTPSESATRSPGGPGVGQQLFRDDARSATPTLSSHRVPPATSPLVTGLAPSGTPGAAHAPSRAARAATARPEPQPTVWQTGPTLTPHNLTANRIGATRDVQPALWAYAASEGQVLIDPHRRPVVLVHGTFGNIDRLTQVAESFRADGRQVFFFAYDSYYTRPEANGAHLARALGELRSFFAGDELDLVGHSQGGIVLRAALNHLDNPRWAEPPVVDGRTIEATWREDAPQPRGGFRKIRAVALDAPWLGLQEISFGMRLSSSVIPEALFVSSALFAQLARPRLEGVELHTFAATEKDFHGLVHTVADLETLDPEALRLVARVLVDPEQLEALPAGVTGERARNASFALTMDARAEELQNQLRRAIAQGTQPTQALLDSVRALGFFVEGDHNTMATNDVFLRRLVREILPNP